MRKLLLVLALLALPGCAALNKPVAPNPDLAAHIEEAQTYVAAALDAADACVKAGVPFCVNLQGSINKARVVATEALAQAKDIGNGDTTLAQTLLRVAMNAVLIFAGL